jgi:DNA (cytosine-5)-methyltransferase 1
LLDLFSGAGGSAVGYSRAGFEVVGVDHVAQPHYPFEFIQADALEELQGLIDCEVDALHGYYLTDFAAIHASPPCQGYHKLGNGTHRQPIGPTRELLEQTGLPYVIENIPDAAWALRDPVLFCGSMFDPVFADRHRLFEANWPLRPPVWPCRHKLAQPTFPIYEHGRIRLRRWPAVYGHGGGKCREAAPAAMEIDWMTREELVEAIPPRFTELIGIQLMQHIGRERAA